MWVGNSSLDVLMEIHKLKDIKKSIISESGDEVGAIMIEENIPSRLLSSLFTYVARDRRSGKACAVNHFIPEGKDEAALFTRRENLALSRKSSRKKIPTNGSSSMMGDLGGAASESHLVLQSLVERGIAMEDMPALASSNAVLMRYTALENSLVCQPQNVNTAGRVFGGYLSKIMNTILVSIDIS